MINKIRLWWNTRKVKKWQARMSADWKKLEAIMQAAEMPSWKRRQIRQDIIKGHDVSETLK